MSFWVVSFLSCFIYISIKKKETQSYTKKENVIHMKRKSLGVSCGHPTSLVSQWSKKKKRPSWVVCDYTWLHQIQPLIVWSPKRRAHTPRSHELCNGAPRGSCWSIRPLAPLPDRDAGHARMHAADRGHALTPYYLGFVWFHQLNYS